MLDSTIQAPQPSYFEKASNFAWSCAKAPVNLAWWCATSTPAKAVSVATCGIVSCSALRIFESCDFSINPHVLIKLPVVITTLPVHSLTYIFNKVLPSITLEGGESLSLSYLLYHAASEEIIYREVCQNRILPYLANILPETAGNVIAHPVTRVALTSLLFALAHTDQWNTQLSVLPHFTGGLIYGAVREISGRNDITIYAHQMHNLFCLYEGTYKP